MIYNMFEDSQDGMAGIWFDNWMLIAIKLYYWPIFMIGINDDINDIFNPKTYSICKL